MPGKLTANVVVRHPESGSPAFLPEGSDLPDWAADLVGDHVLAGEATGDEPEHGSESHSEPVGDPPPIAGAGSSKARWADYARANGVEVSDGASRDEIVDAVRSAGVPVE